MVVQLDPVKTCVSTEMIVTRRGEQVIDAKAVHLDGLGLELISIEWNGEVLTPGEGYSLHTGTLEIFRFPDETGARLRVCNTISPERNTELLGLYLSSGMFCTQNEPEGFRRITFFPDRPDILSRYTIRLEADRSTCPVLLANGNCVSSGQLTETTHFVEWVDPYPKPCYLVAIVAGKLESIADRYTTVSGRDVLLEIYTNPGNTGLCAFAMESLKMAMRWDEQVFGREYDLDRYMIVAVDDFNMGAMENKGLNIFNSKLVLASSETATDSTFEDILSVIAHEYFHNWTGNRITLRDWFQLTLKEGLTVFRDQLFSQDILGAGVKRIDDVDFLRTYQFPEDNGKLSHPIQPKEYLDIDNFYTRTVYEKGAEVIRMAYTLLGRDGFRMAMDLYFANFDGQAITTEKFLECLEPGNDWNWQLFRNWYHRKGTPRLRIEDFYDPNSQIYRIQWKDTAVEMPNGDNVYPLLYPVLYSLHENPDIKSDLKLGINDELDSELMSISEYESTPDQPLEVRKPHRTTGLLAFEGWEGSLEFSGLTSRPILSLFQGFSAPIHWDWDRPEDDYHYLFLHDPDPFTRWDSGFRLKLGEIERLSLASPKVQVSQRLLAVFGKLLEETPQEPSDYRLVSYLYRLPSLTAITNLQNVYRIEDSFRARKILHASLADQFGERFRELYELALAQQQKTSESRIDLAGYRMFQNTCLGFLGEDVELVYRQFSSAKNLTDAIESLRILSHLDVSNPFRDKGFSEFFNKWKDVPLVMDHFFALHASSEARDCLERVIYWKNSQAMDLKNPNRVGALLGTYCRNRLHFHRADGKGVEFIADCILELDPINPQSASRLAKNFSDLGKLPDPLRRNALSALERIRNSRGLSNLVFEVVDSCLS